MSAKIIYQAAEDEPEEIDFLGIHWVSGKQVSLKGDEGDAIAMRLLGHPHFVRDDKAQEREDAEALAKQQAEEAAAEAEAKRLREQQSKK